MMNLFFTVVNSKFKPWGCVHLLKYWYMYVYEIIVIPGTFDMDVLRSVLHRQGHHHLP